MPFVAGPDLAQEQRVHDPAGLDELRERLLLVRGQLRQVGANLRRGVLRGRGLEFRQFGHHNLLGWRGCRRRRRAGGQRQDDERNERDQWFHVRPFGNERRRGAPMGPILSARPAPATVAHWTGCTWAAERGPPAPSRDPRRCFRPSARTAEVSRAAGPAMRRRARHRRPADQTGQLFVGPRPTGRAGADDRGPAAAARPDRRSGGGLVPRTHVLADVAAVDVRPDARAERLGNLAPQLDREVGQAPRRVEHARFDEGAGRARLEAERARPALVERGLVGVERQAADDLRRGTATTRAPG